MALDKLKYTYQDPAKISELNVDDVLNVSNTININGVTSSAQGTTGTQGIQGIQGFFDTSPIVYPTTSASVGFAVQGLIGQSGKLTEWRNSAGVALSAIDTVGNLTKGDGDQIVLASQIF